MPSAQWTSISTMTLNADLDLTSGVLGNQVPDTSPTITWNDDHITVLPAVYNEFDENVCEAVDIPIIQFMAQFPISALDSRNVVHIPYHGVSRETLLQVVGNYLSYNKPIVIRGVERHEHYEELTADYLDRNFAISPHRPVCIHDVMLRSMDHVNTTTTGTIDSFFESMTDSTRIQCILDLPLAQTSLPEPLRNIDHGLVYGWNQTTHSVPMQSDVHPENFTVKGWALLHHAGFLTYPHHDAEGTLTWVRMEVGVKFWVIFRPKYHHRNRLHLQQFATKLVDFTSHKKWLEKHCDGEVIVLRPGDMLIMPPGTIHAVYTPVASFATGGHFYHYMCLHLTELARYIDAEVADSTTNQALEHAVETLRRMMIMVPYLSRRILLYKRSLLGLCIMVTKTAEYRAKGSRKHSIATSETSQPSKDISEVIMESYFGLSRKLRPGTVMYMGDQLMPGERVDRDDLDRVLRRSLRL
ncbi:uncharacterized protein EDB91DRAFT_1256739 [Suillus paluster]|uniref:uncharacterized protein n=1 Tax=Suillus paluster TaxID=48578 RepID=UPI001B87A9F9|nr:uncharacterized protein EDB91DRAFT_1256739 [Suillus paluster]KAG1720983.1 hypothetical protein EDB91DRAFT_1256739 [Suillus paluster]